MKLAVGPDGVAYALKAIEKAKIRGEAGLARIYREKELLGALSHPGIVKMHTTLKDETHLYFLLELLDGGELLWHMRRALRRRVPPSQAAICLGALLLPLRHLERAGVLYRDLKPTNIVFSSSGRLKLIDFGHAKRVAPGERSSSLCGTPHFHAPEIVRGEPHGQPAQLWALGVLLVEILTGRPPFWEGAGLPPLNEQILAADPDYVPVPTEARGLASSLLVADEVERSARFPGGYGDVMRHEWLAALDWEAIEAGACVPDFEYDAHAREVRARLAPPSAAAVPDAAAVAAAFADFDI